MQKHLDQLLRQQLVAHIKGGEAFTPLSSLLQEIPFELLGKVPDGLPYSFYQLFWHIRKAQLDILEFSRNADYESPKWPEGYWPAEEEPKSEAAWKELQQAYFHERDEFCKYITNPENSLFEPFSHGKGQTLFREAQLILEHTAYHTGQLLILLRLLGLHK